MASMMPGGHATVFILPLVKHCFDLLVDAFAADRNLRFYLGRVELQRTIFQTWHNPEPHHGDVDGDVDGPLDLVVAPRAGQDARRAQRQHLVLFLRTLSNPEKLKVKYGLRMEKLRALQRLDELATEMKYVADYLYKVDTRHFTWFQDTDSFQALRYRHMDFLKTIRFVVSGGDSEMADLILLLEDFNRHLQLFESPQRRDVIRRELFERVVKDLARDPDRTKRLEEAAAYEAKHAIDDLTKARYDDLSKLTNFSLAVQSASPSMPRRKIFSHADFSFDTPYKMDKNTTLARLFDYPTKYQSRLVLVEWITLRISPSGTTLDSSDEAKVTWFILHAEKPQKLLLPATIGLIMDDSDPWRIGMVYQLPPHIRGNLPTKVIAGGRVVRSPKTIAAERMPTSLRQLMLKTKTLDLGIRFEIAKKILDAVHLMHTARFTHRNIRPDNILFFPATDKNNDPDPSTLDLANPIIFGFHDARLEIQTSTDPPVPWTQPEGLKPILKKPHPRTRDVILEAYSHPNWRLDPRRSMSAAGTAPFRRHYDLYSVGCVLLELGLWETLDQIEGREIALRAPGVGEVKDGAVVEGVLTEKRGEVWKDFETVERAAGRLDGITGRIYAEVTRACLSAREGVKDVLEYERRLAAALAQVKA